MENIFKKISDIFKTQNLNFLLPATITKELRYINIAGVAKSLQSCPTLCDPIDVSPPGSLIPGILQARILKWVAISLSNAQN